MKILDLDTIIFLPKNNLNKKTIIILSEDKDEYSSVLNNISTNYDKLCHFNIITLKNQKIFNIFENARSLVLDDFLFLGSDIAENSEYSKDIMRSIIPLSFIIITFAIKNDLITKEEYEYNMALVRKPDILNRKRFDLLKEFINRLK